MPPGLCRCHRALSVCHGDRMTGMGHWGLSLRHGLAEDGIKSQHAHAHTHTPLYHDTKTTAYGI